MRAVIQRVKSAQVSIQGTTVGDIDRGLLVFLGVGRSDDTRDANYLASKIADLRIFEDAEGKFNLSLRDIQGKLLVVSQFTLFGDCRKGRRPSFTEAARPAMAQKLYDHFISTVQQEGLEVECGKFQAMMEVHLTNDGPVTILLDSQKRF